MDLDDSKNKLTEIRKILKERRKQKNSIKLETPPHQNTPVEEIVNNVPFSTPVFTRLDVSVDKPPTQLVKEQNPPNVEWNKTPVLKETKTPTELKKRSASEPPPNVRPLFYNSTGCKETEMKKQQGVLEHPAQKDPVIQEKTEPENKKTPPPPNQRHSKRFCIF